MRVFFQKNQLYQSIILSVLLGMLAACTTLGCDQDTTTWPARQRQLQGLRTWQAKGIVSAKTSTGSDNAYVAWQQSPTQFAITFSSALGGGARLQGKTGYVQLIAADGQTYHGHDPNALAKQLLGWSLPVNGLQYWVKGLPAPGKQQLQLSPQGQIATLVQQGWHIHYLRYQRIGAYYLPYEIILKRSTLQLHIIIKQWMLG